jgi:hypothetical protein
MPVSQARMASGIASTSRQIGQCLGIAVTGSILPGNMHDQSLLEGFVPASCACWPAMGVVVVFVLGLGTTSQWALGTAARTAELLDPGRVRQRFQSLPRLGGQVVVTERTRPHATMPRRAATPHSCRPQRPI